MYGVNARSQKRSSHATVLIGRLRGAGPARRRRGKAQLAVRGFARRRRASRRHLHRHPDLQGQRRRPAGLYRRCHRQGRRRLARHPLGRADAVELGAPDRSANSPSRINCGPHATLTIIRAGRSPPVAESVSRKSGCLRAHAAMIASAYTYFGRAPAIIKQRERIKRQTIQHRRLLHRKRAA